MGAVIMLSGPVGAGKTTVARTLIPLLAGPVSYIEGDDFWRFVARTKSPDRRVNFPIVIRSMIAAAAPFARTGYDVLLDFSIPPDFLAVARRILKETPMDFILLRPSLGVCEIRAAERSEGRITDYAPYRDFYAMFDGMDRHVLEDDQADAATLAGRILQGLDAGAFRVS